MRTELRAKLGLAQQPSGATLIDLIYDCLGPLSVPDGSTGVRPLMPTSADDLEIHLSGHSLVKSLKFTPAQLLAANPTGHANKIRDVIRTNLDIADDAGKLPEALGHWLMRCGYSRAEIKAGAPGKKAEFERLCSTKVRVKYPNLKPKEPKTQVVETWPTNGDITSSQDHSWARPSSVAWANPSGTIVASSGTAKEGQSGYGSHKFARCESAVSSEDHWTQGNVTCDIAYLIGTACRMAGTNTETAYNGEWWYNDSLRLKKWVNGTPTQLASTAKTGGLSSVLFKTRGNGSTISVEVAGHDTISVTDPAITGNLKGGICMISPTVSNNCIGAVTIDDGVPVAPVAAFTGTPLSGTAPLSVVFTDSSTNTPTSWLWEKSSDGGSNWSNFASGPTTQNPTESFTAGTWAVRLTATNAGGSDGETKLAYVTVDDPPSGKPLAGSYSLGTWRGLGL
jgi:hypothetical protein